MNLDRFTLVSNGVVEFKSTWRTTGEKPDLVDSCTGTDEPAPQIDASTDAAERKDAGTQTGGSPRHSNATCDDAKLANWLRKVCPLVEEELSFGITDLPDANDNFSDLSGRLLIRKHQELTMRKLNPELENGQKLNMGAAAWLSIRTRDAPLLVLSCGSHHEAWCEHTFASITAFTPKRDAFGSVHWVELSSCPVKACIETLETNPFNKDMFAGGTVSGDVYIWQYELNFKHEQNSFTEIFSETTDFGKVVDMTWIRPNPMTKDFGLLSCHSDATVILWKIGKHVGKDKTFRISNSTSSRKALILTQILAISNSEFVVGSVDGSMLLCSMTQLIPIGSANNGNSTTSAKKSYFAPSFTELKPHSFAVTTLLKLENDRQQFLISCDLTGEVYFHDVTDAINTTPTLVIKMPLPFKNRIICTDDMRFILSPNTDGALEIYNIDSGSQDVVECGGMKGRPGLIRASANGKWLITGPYDGSFVVYAVEKDG
ncbi:uncharacterized protein LOC120414623 [Culex pipiens pallens]|uniref:uncharacterized protein LOC120414623 n=1 Tax=Culex pipiens pallens TaxID=42434 RepID=UPI001952BAA5|nr:uncharacterized protein LOC120414623 [Culex pipiens pallens]XP_039431800.1 uncharacterized protein LOC120414623 [Culex pipiens pallens]